MKRIYFPDGKTEVWKPTFVKKQKAFLGQKNDDGTHMCNMPLTERKIPLKMTKETKERMGWSNMSPSE